LPNQVAGHDFHRNGSVERDLSRPIHGAHRTTAKHFVDHATTKRRPGNKVFVLVNSRSLALSRGCALLSASGRSRSRRTEATPTVVRGGRLLSIHGGRTSQSGAVGIITLHDEFIAALATLYALAGNINANVILGITNRAMLNNLSRHVNQAPASVGSLIDKT
jgi:hypothetical protein